MTAEDDLIGRLRAIGSVWAEDEAAFMLDVTRDPAALDAVLAARRRGVPLEQALGRARFAGVEVAVGADQFVPRPRAQVLVDVAVEVAPAARVVVDLGCGGGALAAALATRLPRAEVHGVDIDDGVLATARRNGARYRFSPHLGDWWGGLPGSLLGRVDLAVAYLPHVPTGRLDDLPRDYRDHEPARSVDGGPDGLVPLRAVLAGARGWLASDAVLVTLVAAEQVDAALIAAAGWRTEVRLDDDEDDAVLRLRPRS